MGSNIETVNGVYAAFAKGDVPAVLGAMAERIDWQEPDSLPFENQTTPQGVAENIFGPVVTQLEGFTVSPREIVDGGDIVCAIGTYSGKGVSTGVPLNAEFVHVWRFDSAGKVNGFRTYTDTHQWLEALGQ